MFSLALFALFIIIHRITENKYTLPLILSFVSVIAGAAYLECFNNNISSVTDYLTSAGTVTVTGEITEAGRATGTAYYVIDINTVNGENIGDYNVTVYLNDTLYRGMQVKTTGKFKSFTPTSNYIYSYSQNEFLRFYPDKVSVLRGNSGFNGIFGRIKDRLEYNASRIFHSKTSGVAIAMGLGNKQWLDTDIKDAFIYTGLSHALVVSGLHMSFIAMVTAFLLYFIPVHKKIKNIVIIAFIMFFMSVIGFTPSIIRAGVLVIAYNIGRNLIVETDGLTVLAVVILATLVSNPYSANNAGLLLSYFAYFGVIFSINLAAEKEWGKGKTLLMTTVFAQLFTAPVMSMLDMEVSLLSPLFNVALAIPVNIICVLSFFLPLIYEIPLIGVFLCTVLGPVNDYLIAGLVEIAFFARENLSFAMVNLGSDRVKFTVFVSAALVGIVLLQFKNSRLRKILIFTVPVTVFLCYNYLNRDVVQLRVFDGSSHPAYVISYKDENYLVAAENINNRKLEKRLEELKTDSFEDVILCTNRQPNTDLYSEYSDSIITVNSEMEYNNGLFSVKASVRNRAAGYIINLSGCEIAFSHNKADFTGHTPDIYFFGKEAPKDIVADNYFYFYPVVKATTEMAAQKQAVELYDTLTVKIHAKTGKYTIVKDVKNFGGQL